MMRQEVAALSTLSGFPGRRLMCHTRSLSRQFPLSLFSFNSDTQSSTENAFRLRQIT